MQLQSIKSRICDDIVKGTFAPDTRLTIDMLASRYQSSHMPIREALRELAGEGLVRYEARRGARALPVGRRFIEDLLMLRTELEPLLASLAAKKIDEHGLAEVCAIQDELEAAVEAGDNQGAVIANSRFHRCINRIADNTEVSTIIDRHWLVLTRLWAHYGHVPDRFPGVISDHRSLITALESRASDDAGALMRAHVIKAKYQLINRVDLMQHNGHAKGHRDGGNGT